MKSRVVALCCALCGLISLLCVGCLIQTRGVAVVASAPVVIEPAPADRLYIYDAGFPPGTYLYGGFYFYMGHRYERNGFITKVVNVNIQKNRYVNVTQNRVAGKKIETQHAAEYKKNQGRPQSGKPAKPPKKEPTKDSKDAKDSNKN